MRYSWYGINSEGLAETMVATYTWGRHLARLGSFYDLEGATNLITDITIRRLAAMNNISA